MIHNMNKQLVRASIGSALVAVALIAGGCQESGTNWGAGTVPRYVEGRAEVFSPPQIMLVGPDANDMRDNTLFEPPILSRDSAELLRVTAPVRVTGDKRLHIQYRVTFFDKTGQPLPGPTAWFRQSLTPGSRELIVFNSTSPRAEGFQLELRYAR